MLIATARASGHEVVAVYDDDLSKVGHAVLGVPVRGALEGAMGLNHVRAVIGVGENADRQSIATRIDMPCASIAHSNFGEIGPSDFAALLSAPFV